MSFWSELKRRNVFKVGAAYVIVAWLLAQVVSLAFPAFHMPQWTVTFVMSLLILGLPLTLIIAWAFELTPEGVKRSENVPLDESITHVTGRKLNYVLAGLIIVLVGYIVIDKAFVSKEFVETKVTQPVAEQAATAPEVKESPKTIAVLPFSDLSPEKDQEYFVDGLTEELLNSLAKTPGLLVTARTSSFAFKGKDKTVQEIANVLGVENVLEGSVRKAGDALRITAQLIRASDGFHLWSETYDRQLKDIFAVQEDIATTVANELKLTLGIGSSFKQLGGTENLEAYDLYLVSVGQLQAASSAEECETVLKSIDKAIALDPGFALAWAKKAETHSGLAILSPVERAAVELEKAQNAAQKAIDLQPTLRAGYNRLGFVKTAKGDWIGAESSYREALELQAGTSSEYDLSIAIHYHSVGHFRKANKIFKNMRQTDPLNLGVRAHYVLNLAFLGDMQQAEQEYERCRISFGNSWDSYNWTILFFHLTPDNFVIKDENYYIFEIARQYLDSPKEGLLKLHSIYDNEKVTSVELLHVSMCAAYFDDPEFAIDSMRKAVSLEASGFFHMWFPVEREVRQTPLFRQFLREIGLVDYWEEFGWPDICRPLDNGDFVCD